jgi:hypothetical protein
MSTPGWPRRRYQVDADTTKAEGADVGDERVGCEGRYIMYRGLELMHLVIKFPVEKSFIERPNESNSMEHQLSMVKRRTY